jgi:hypothetical protein
MTTEKSRETRLRRMAERQGLTITKSRRRDPRAIDYGRWWVVQSGGDRRVVELTDIDALERYLEGEGRPRTDYWVDVQTPVGHEIGPVASPSDLAYPLAHALLIIDQQGFTRPPYTGRASEDGHARELTKAEQEAFDTALEQAFDRLKASTLPAGEPPRKDPR